MVERKQKDFETHTNALARYAKALSHPARIAILETLAARSTCICGEIVEVIPLAQSTVSQHLRELKDAGLIRGEIDGLKSCYCLNPEAVQELQELTNSLFKVLNQSVKSNKCC